MKNFLLLICLCFVFIVAAPLVRAESRWEFLAEIPSSYKKKDGQDYSYFFNYKLNQSENEGYSFICNLIVYPFFEDGTRTTLHLYSSRLHPEQKDKHNDEVFVNFITLDADNLDNHLVLVDGKFSVFTPSPDGKGKQLHFEYDPKNSGIRDERDLYFPLAQEDMLTIIPMIEAFGLEAELKVAGGEGEEDRTINLKAPPAGQGNFAPLYKCFDDQKAFAGE